MSGVDLIWRLHRIAYMLCSDVHLCVCVQGIHFDTFNRAFTQFARISPLCFMSSMLAQQI